MNKSAYKRRAGKGKSIADRLRENGVISIRPKWKKWAKKYLNKKTRSEELCPGKKNSIIVIYVKLNTVMSEMQLIVKRAILYRNMLIIHIIQNLMKKRCIRIPFWYILKMVNLHDIIEKKIIK